MSDTFFQNYELKRMAAEQAIENALFGWSMDGAPETMTLADLRSLKTRMVSLMNHYTYECFEIGGKQVSFEDDSAEL